MKKTKNNLGRDVSFGVAAIAAAVAAYYYFGKDGKKNRESSQAWIVKVKADVLAEVKKLKNVSQETYTQSLGKVLKKYKKSKKENPEAYALLEKELKSHWPKIAKHLPKDK